MLRERAEKILNECIETREEVFELATRLNAEGKEYMAGHAFKESNDLTELSEFLAFVLDEKDERSFSEWLNR